MLDSGTCNNTDTHTQCNGCKWCEVILSNEKSIRNVTYRKYRRIVVTAGRRQKITGKREAVQTNAGREEEGNSIRLGSIGPRFRGYIKQETYRKEGKRSTAAVLGTRRNCKPE